MGKVRAIVVGILILAGNGLVWGVEWSGPLGLGAAIDSALEHNLGLRVERHGVAGARESVTVAEGVFDPGLFGTWTVSQRTVSSTASLTGATQSDRRVMTVGATQTFETGARARLSSSLVRSDSNAATNLSNLDYHTEIGLEIRQPLAKDAGAKTLLAPIRRAEAAYEEAMRRFQASVLDTIAETERLYWELSFARESLALRRSSVRVAEKLLEETEKRLRVGLATEIDVLRARATLASYREAILTAEQGVAEAADALAEQMGLLTTGAADAPGMAGWETEALADEMSAPPAFGTVWETALRLDPRSAAQSALVEQRAIDRRVARQSLRPQVDLVAGGSLIGRDGISLSRSGSNALERDGEAWSLGIEVSMPWERRAERAEARRADLALAREEWRLLEIRQSLYRNIRLSWRQWSTLIDRLSLASDAVELRRRAFAEAESRFRAGLITFREVLEAQQDLDESTRARLEVVMGLQRARIDLQRMDGTLLDRHGYTWKETEAMAGISPLPPLAKGEEHP